jgi:hypothetical protein
MVFGTWQETVCKAGDSPAFVAPEHRTRDLAKSLGHLVPADGVAKEISCSHPATVVESPLVPLAGLTATDWIPAAGSVIAAAGLVFGWSVPGSRQRAVIRG